MSMLLQSRCAVRATLQQLSSTNISSWVFFVLFGGIATLAWLLFDGSEAHADAPTSTQIAMAADSNAQPSTTENPLPISLTNSDQLAEPLQLNNERETVLGTVLPEINPATIVTNLVPKVLQPATAEPQQPANVTTAASPQNPETSASTSLSNVDVVANDDATPSFNSYAETAESATQPGAELPHNAPKPEQGHMTSGSGHFNGAESTSGITISEPHDRHHTSNDQVSTRSLDIPGSPSFCPD
ncbi:MAG: hypothetical protein HOQ05_05430 [Corynebacteriales bacterium]|nr:hypothetical protein [Mycobacteriales bacterium]